MAEIISQYDIAIIGGGVIGSAIARELSRFNAKICVIEKNADVCEGTSKANSAIIHAGFDAEPGSQKAEMNAKGNQMMDKVASELDIPFERVGAFVVCMSEEDIPALEKLKERGEKNGIPNLEIVYRDRLLQMEPNLSDTVFAALYAPTSGITCPFEMTLGFAENAALNGTEFLFETEVKDIKRENDIYNITTNKGDIKAKAVVNAAGVYADFIHNLICNDKIHITPRKGEYNLLDRGTEGYVKQTIFQLPTTLGKGVLVTPTVYGNVLVGPTSTDIDDKNMNRTTRDGIIEITKKSALSMKDVPLWQTITSFAGLRAHLDTDDFILKESAELFFDAAGIESPGLTSAPAIGEKMSKLISSKMNLTEKDNFNPIRKRVVHVAELPFEERQKLIAENPAYGAIVCRCEEVSEGEVIDSIRKPIGAKSLDGVKRRTRACAGRCQAGFCTPRIMELLAQELKLDMTKVRKNDGESNFVFEKTRG